MAKNEPNGVTMGWGRASVVIRRQQGPATSLMSTQSDESKSENETKSSCEISGWGGFSLRFSFVCEVEAY